MVSRLLLPGLLLALTAGPAAAQAPYRFFYQPVPGCYPPVIYVPLCPPPWLEAWPVAPSLPAPPRVRLESPQPETGSPGLAKPEPAKPDPGKQPDPEVKKDQGTSRDGPGGVAPARFDIKPPGAGSTDRLDIPKPSPPVPEKPMFDPDQVPLVAPPRPADPDAIAPPRLPVPQQPKTKPDGDTTPSIPLLPPPTTVTGPESPKLPPLRGVPDPTLPGLSIPVPAVDPAKSTSKSSPLMARPRSLVDVIPVEGVLPADPRSRRQVNFFNHTDRDLRLTVEGQSITLPRRHHVTARVPVTFTWRLEGEAERRQSVPAAVPGLEVVIRR